MENYSALCDSCLSAYLVLSADGYIINGNFTASTLLGEGRDQLRKRKFSSFIAEDYKNRWKQLCLLVKQIEGIQSCELSLRKADGNSLYVRLDCLYKQGFDNSPKLLITLHEITGLTQVDEPLKFTAEDSETQYGIIVADANKNIIRVNQAFSVITGYAAEEANDNKPSFLLTDNNCGNPYQSIWLDVYNIGFWQGEVWETRKNGKNYLAWLSLTAVHDKDDCISHYVCSFSDMSSPSHLERDLFRSKKRRKTRKVDPNDEANKSRHQLALSREVQGSILPFLRKLKKVSAGRIQSSQLISIIEMNLLQLLNAFGSNDNMLATLQLLSPVEAQVASLVRQGLPTKVIAATLNITEGTVSIHRNHIRKKLGLNNKICSLQTYLKSLLE